MICILAGSRLEAERFAKSQEWDHTEWFCPLSVDQVKVYKNFHTLVIGTFWEHPIPVFVEEVYRIAKIYGYKK